MSLKIEHLAGVYIEQPFWYPANRGDDHARKYVELVAEDHTFTFRTCWQMYDPRATESYGPPIGDLT